MTPFRSSGAQTVNIDVSSSSQAVKLWDDGSASKSVRIMNNGTATAWIAFGPSTVTASVSTGMPVGPGVTEVQTVSSTSGIRYAAAIAAGSTGKIYFTPGMGF